MQYDCTHVVPFMTMGKSFHAAVSGMCVSAVISAFVVSVMIVPQQAHAQAKELIYQNGSWGVTNNLTGQFSPLSSFSPQALTTILGGAGGGPHPICVAYDKLPPQTKAATPPPPCYEPSFTSLGNVMGVCVPNTGLCKGVSAPGLGGGSMGLGGSLQSIFGSLLGQVLSKLMQPTPPTPPPSTGGYGTTPPPYGSGCLGTYFDTSDISLISNPCARYTPPVSNNINNPTDPNACSTLNQLLGLCGTNPNCPTVTPANCAAGSHPVSGGQDFNGCVLPDTCAPDTDSNLPPSPIPTVPQPPPLRVIFATTTIANIFAPQTGARGDINVRTDGATIIGGTRDVQGNVEVAGFFGSETFGDQGSQGLVSGWCKSRPWATNFLSKIVSPSFFDGLCTWRGFQVGTPPPPKPAVTLQQTPKPKPIATTTTPTTPQIPPKVDIWAVPASVPLGGRTSIFWNTQGVTSCTETSPNGGFNQNSLSGGAATQPITSATTFSISCLAPDGTPVTGSVTVNLKI